MGFWLSSSSEEAGPLYPPRPARIGWLEIWFENALDAIADVGVGLGWLEVVNVCWRGCWRVWKMVLNKTGGRICESLRGM